MPSARRSTSVSPDAGKSQSEVRALTWQFREPIATPILDGKSIGRHYAGPNWEHTDGSAVKGKVIASAPGVTSNDIPSLELEVVDHRGNGILSAATAVQRINTRGGVACFSVSVNADGCLGRRGANLAFGDEDIRGAPSSRSEG